MQTNVSWTTSLTPCTFSLERWHALPYAVSSLIRGQGAGEGGRCFWLTSNFSTVARCGRHRGGTAERTRNSSTIVAYPDMQVMLFFIVVNINVCVCNRTVQTKTKPRVITATLGPRTNDHRRITTAHLKLWKNLLHQFECVCLYFPVMQCGGHKQVIQTRASFHSQQTQRINLTSCRILVLCGPR